jgi:hypothetical protein
MRALAYRFLVMNGELFLLSKIILIIFLIHLLQGIRYSVWRFITREMRAAAADLPETPIQEGRLTLWSAEAMLARFYLTRSGVESLRR